MVVDLTLLVLLPLLMAYSLLSETVHEWLGIAMAVSLILHHVLNLHWYKNLLRGNYTVFRMVLTIVNVLLLADFLLLFYSGADLSKHLLPFLPELGSASFSRMLHLSASHWGLLLMSFHLGLHMKQFTIPLKNSRYLRIILTILSCVAAFYGCFALAAIDFAAYLLPASAFLFFDASQPLARLLVNLLSIMILFVLLGHGTARLTQNKRNKE